MRIYVLIIALSILTIGLLLKKDKKITKVTDKNITKTVEINYLPKKQFSRVLKLRGFTEASRVVILKSQVEGKISSKLFEKGTFYKAGSQLLMIDPEDKVAKTKEMEALFNQRKKEYEVAEQLYNKGFRSELKLSKSRTNFENALALFEKSQVELSNTKVVIPFDSIVDDSYVELGDYLKKGDEIAKVVDLNPLHVNLSTNEKDINKITLNQKVNVIIGNKFLTGKVNFISRTSDKETRNFRIQVEIENKNNEIFSGLSSEIELKLKPVAAFFIPSSLITLNDLGEIGIKTVNNNIVEFMPIKIISDSGSGYWINLENFKEDEIPIITQGHEFTVDGETVKIKIND